MFHPRDKHDANRLAEALIEQFELTRGDPISYFLKISLRRNPLQRRL
jgi:hypothetical protein